VRHLIDQHRSESGQPPPLALTLPDDPRLRAQHVRPHHLADYDALHGDDEQQSDNEGHDNHEHDDDHNA
jgi:hypothetical protein